MDQWIKTDNVGAVDVNSNSQIISHSASHKRAS